MAEIQESNMSTNSPSPGIKLFGAMITIKERSSQPNNDHHHHHDHDQENTKSQSDESQSPTMADKRPDKIIPCPRCKSMETKFCYFNNYNVNQPRHFCKGCQRYWTAGGALRNVPVGAGRRKAKPPCMSVAEGCLFGGSGEDRLEYEKMVEGWRVVEEGGFRHLFPAKRRRCGSNGQSC